MARISLRGVLAIIFLGWRCYSIYTILKGHTKRKKLIEGDHKDGELNMGVNNISFSKYLKQEWPALLVVAGSLAAGLILYPYLPENIPSHWNIKGEVDAYASRFWGAFGLPLLSAGIYITMTFLPVLDPRRENYKMFAGAYRLIKFVLIFFMSVLYAIIIFSAFGCRLPVDRLVTAAVSLLILIFGSLMGQLKHNYFVGIRTPWTLASENVWQKTHRLGGRVWVIAGLAGLLSSLFGGKIAVSVLAFSLGTALIVPVVYSYSEFKKESTD